MKCKMCKKKIQSVEIRGTLGMRTGYCCSEIQVDIDSLRPKVRECVIEEEKFWRDLAFELDNLVQHQSTFET